MAGIGGFALDGEPGSEVKAEPLAPGAPGFQGGSSGTSADVNPVNDVNLVDDRLKAYAPDGAD